MWEFIKGNMLGRGLDKGRGVAVAYLSDPPISLITSCYLLLPILHPSALPPCLQVGA